MSETKHTPGPWRVEGNDIRCNDTPDDTGTFVAEMQSSRSPEQCLADAQLIAAAPTMLEALKAIEARLTQAARAFYGTGTRKALETAFDGWKEDIGPARAAIAKAEGQP